MKVYDLLGNEIKTLVNGNQDKGIHKVIFDVRDLADGIYYYRLEARDYKAVRKMVVMKN
jgi:hypothetical protein